MQRSEARERGLLPTETALVGPLKPVEDHLASQSDYTRLDQPYNYTPYTSLPYNSTPYDASEARAKDRDSLFQGRYIHDPRLSEFEFVAIKSYAMQQTQRMRSAELHYIDHPGFGLLIKIKKVEAPTPSAFHPYPLYPLYPLHHPHHPHHPRKNTNRRYCRRFATRAYHPYATLFAALNPSQLGRPPCLAEWLWLERHPHIDDSRPG